MRRRTTHARGIGRVLVALAVLVGALAVPGLASAHTTEAIADTGGATLELALLGSPVTVDVMLDTDFGTIDEVAVSDTAFTEEKADEHKVRFENADDTTRIEVKAKKSKLKTEVKTAELGDVVGEHTWSTEALFMDGDTPILASVAFTVGDDGSGTPTLEIGTITVDPAVSYEVKGPETKTEDDEVEVEAKIDFLWNGFRKTLKIEVEVEEDHDDDGDRPVKLKVELKGKDEQKLRLDSLADILGDHTWMGTLCDGTTAMVAYTVNDDGSITMGDVTFTKDGDPADVDYEVKDKDHGFEVKFDDHGKVKVELKQKDDGTWELKVKSKTTEKCDKKKHDDDDDHKKKKDDDDHEKKKDDDDHDDDD